MDRATDEILLETMTKTLKILSDILVILKEIEDNTFR